MNAADLRDAIAHLATGSPACRRVATALDAWRQADDAVTLERALGVGDGWRRAQRILARDAILAEIAVKHFGGMTGRRGAAAIVLAVSKYEAGAFRVDQAAGRRPDGLRGLLFDLLATGAPTLGEEAIRRLGIFRPRESPADAVSSRHAGGKHERTA